MKKLISFILLATVTFSVTSTVFAEKVGFEALIYPEEEISVPSDWAKETIEEAKTVGIINENEEYDYSSPITREKFCELIYNCIKIVGNAELRPDENKFADTTNEKVIALAVMGIINGKSETEFAPDDSLTREEAATILIRTAEFMGIGMPENAYDRKIYNDEAEISEWAFPSVHYCRKLNIMVGTSETEFSPKETYTSEQAIATIMRLYEAHIGVGLEE